MSSMYFWSVSLVYQLSGQFQFFLVDQKIWRKIWSTKKEIWSTEKKQVGWQKKGLLYVPKKIGIPKNNLVGQKNEKLTGQLVYQWDWPIVQTIATLNCSEAYKVSARNTAPKNNLSLSLSSFSWSKIQEHGWQYC